MQARLTIEKQGNQVSILFNSHPYKYKDDDGQVQQKTIQVGLGVFMKTLDAYLTSIGVNHHLNQLAEEEQDSMPETENW